MTQPLGPDSAPPPQAAAPPVIIHNHNTAQAAAYTYGPRGYRRRQSGMVHLLLLLFTGGIGNVVYALHIARWNRRRGL